MLQHEALEFPFLNLVPGNVTNVLLLDYRTAPRLRGFYRDIGDVFYFGPQKETVLALTAVQHQSRPLYGQQRAKSISRRTAPYQVNAHRHRHPMFVMSPCVNG